MHRTAPFYSALFLLIAAIVAVMTCTGCSVARKGDAFYGQVGSHDKDINVNADGSIHIGEANGTAVPVQALKTGQNIYGMGQLGSTLKEGFGTYRAVTAGDNAVQTSAIKAAAGTETTKILSGERTAAAAAAAAAGQ